MAKPLVMIACAITLTPTSPSVTWAYLVYLDIFFLYLGMPCIFELFSKYISSQRATGLFSIRGQPYLGNQDDAHLMNKLLLAANCTDIFLSLMSAVLLCIAGVVTGRAISVLACVPWMLSILAALAMDLAHAAKILKGLSDNDHFENLDIPLDTNVALWVLASLVYIIMLVLVCISLCCERRQSDDDDGKF